MPVSAHGGRCVPMLMELNHVAFIIILFIIPYKCIYRSEYDPDVSSV